MFCPFTVRRLKKLWGIWLVHGRVVVGSLGKSTDDGVNISSGAARDFKEALVYIPDI
jgi:hypothetical protein